MASTDDNSDVVTMLDVLNDENGKLNLASRRIKSFNEFRHFMFSQTCLIKPAQFFPGVMRRTATDSSSVRLFTHA